MSNFSINKSERLKSKKLIGRMFKDGKAFGAYPLRLVYLEIEEAQGDFPIQFAVAVPKKNFKSAVARNRIKRKIREAWRLNKSWVYRKMEHLELRYAFMFIYVGKEDLPYSEIENSVRFLNNKFVKKNIYRKPNPKQENKPLS